MVSISARLSLTRSSDISGSPESQSSIPPSGPARSDRIPDRSRQIEIKSGKVLLLSSQAFSPLPGESLDEWYQAHQINKPRAVGVGEYQQLGQFLLGENTDEAQHAVKVIESLWLVQREVNLIKSGLVSS